MSPEEMELAYALPGKKTAIAASSAGDLWGGYAGSSGGSDGGQRQGGQGGGRARRASQPMDGRTTADPTAGQLMCPSHGKLCKKGICSGMSRLVKEEERKKREVERGGGGGRRGGFCSTFGLLVH